LSTENFNDLDATILDPKIIVFHNVISDCDAFIKYYEDNAEWEGWYGFGRQVIVSGSTLDNWPHFPTEQEWTDEVLDSVSPDAVPDVYRKKLGLVFHKASKAYIDHTGVNLPNWNSMVWGLARYIPDENILGREDLTMNYHPDYEPLRHEQEGDKYAITSVFYPNDEYEGGEISFKIITDDGSYKTLDYKPVKGDLIFFPSGHPYYHGVKRIWNNAKYIVRMYWLYSDEGSDDWKALREKYGNRFREMEQKRIKDNHMIMDPYMHSMFTVKEYYDHLEAGTLPPRDTDGRPD
jgi:signal peptidase I